MTLLGVKRKLKLKTKNHTAEIHLSLQFQGDLEEYHWDKLDDPKTQKKLEQALSKELTKACQSLVRYTQQVGSDPLGIGDLIRAKDNSYWKKTGWEKHEQTAYREIPVTVTAKLDIKQYGMIK